MKGHLMLCLLVSLHLVQSNDEVSRMEAVEVNKTIDELDIGNLDTVNFENSNGYRIKSISNEILPDVSKYSEYWEKFEPPYDIRKNYAYYLSGYDEENRPIWIIEMGKWNFRKSVEAGGETFKSFDKHTAQIIYRMFQSMYQISTSEFPVNEVIIILDLDGLGLEQVTHVPTLSFVANWIRRYLSIIDHHLYYGCAINTNSLAHGVINIMRPVLGRVFERVEVFGTNSQKFIPQLLKRCPKHSLPDWYGGSKTFEPVKVYG